MYPLFPHWGGKVQECDTGLTLEFMRVIRVDAIPVHFNLEIPIPKTKLWEYEDQSDRPHANVCVFAMYPPGVDGRVN